MPSVFIIKEKIENPKAWYDKEFGNNVEWEHDEILKSYYADNVYIFEKEDAVSFQDMSDLYFISWDVNAWIKLAAGKELVYGYYSEEMLEAEFVHIKDGKCIRDYREYEGQVEVDEGETPEFTDWVSVSAYVDENML